MRDLEINDLGRSNVTQVHKTVSRDATCAHGAQILLIFALRQAVSEISDILCNARPWNDLERSNVTRVHKTVSLDATCAHGAQISLILALRQAVSEISDILWCATLKLPWKVKCDSGPLDGQYTCYLCPQDPNFAYFRSMASRFRDKWHFVMRDLEMTLKGQMWLGSTRQSVHMLHVPTGPKFCLFLLYDKRFPR
jgi:hypothetical protein